MRGKFIKYILLCLLIISCAAKNEYDDFFSTQNIPLNFNSEFQVRSKSLTPLLILGENSTKTELLKVHIKPIKDSQNAMEEIKKSLVLILSQYEFSMAPYPGQITAATNCGTTFRPKLVREGRLTYLKAFANARLALSICAADGFNYNLSTAYFVNKENSILIIADFYQQPPASPGKEIKLYNENFKNFKNVDLSPFSPLMR